MKPICFCLLDQMLLGPEACKPQPLKAWRQRTGLKDPQGWGRGRGVRVLRGYGGLYLGLTTDSPKALSLL